MVIQPKPTAKLLLWPDGTVTIEWHFEDASSLDIDTSEAVTKAAIATLEGWDPK